MQTIRVALEYVACYSSAFLIGCVIGGVVGFYARGMVEQSYDDSL